MRQFIRLTISAAVTFTLGVTLSLCWSHFFPRQVSLCMLARNSSAYHQKIVRVVASASVISSHTFDSNYITIYDPGCAEPDAWARVRLDESAKLSAELEAFIDSPQEEVRNAEIVVVGQFDQAATMGCFAPRFAISATSIGLLSPVSLAPLPKMSKGTSP
jgi:hypothetical protein